MQVRTIATIIVWISVALLLLNRAYQTEWMTPLAIVLAVIAAVVYFIPRIKKQKPTTAEAKRPEPEKQA
ncbi:MAG: hypothetical protein NWF03_03155 [Candidatus Bathyarchaeota archaeon]|nr:hypothetical protein [Candidatus Bathyarchaeota archaeon]